MEKIGIRQEENTSKRAWFDCPGCKSYHAVYIEGDKSKHPVWSWNKSLTEPTFKPSIMVKWPSASGNNICHSYVTDGKIRFLNDCTHDLKEQTVDLPDFKM